MSVDIIETFDLKLSNPSPPPYLFPFITESDVYLARVQKPAF